MLFLVCMWSVQKIHNPPESGSNKKVKQYFKACSWCCFTEQKAYGSAQDNALQTLPNNLDSALSVLLVAFSSSLSSQGQDSMPTETTRIGIPVDIEVMPPVMHATHRHCIHFKKGLTFKVKACLH